MKREEVWIWTELLAFDCTAEDCGVQAYLDRLGFTRDGISFLLSSMDFILLHKGMESEYALFPDVCTRFGHAGNEERKQQKWSNYLLKKLIDQLHRHSIKVFASIFILNMQNRFHEEYVSMHPEVRLGDKIYGINNAISMLARLKDGTLFEDVFTAKLAETVRDYDFDGWHGADGQGPGWNLTHSDSSDSFVMQFAEYIGREKLPPQYLEPCDDSEEKMTARLDHIWQNFQREWADFTSMRWQQFWLKASGVMHDMKREVMINSPFAKSIFESIFYFGMDYRALKDCHIDYLITESVATSCALNYGEYERVFEFSAMIAEMRAVLPEMKLIVMPGVKDVVESYDSLRHAPCQLERDFFANVNQSTIVNGQAQRAADGYLVCLGDGITPQEWRFLENIHRESFEFEFDRAGEMVWLVVPEIFDALRDDHAAHGTWAPYQYVSALTETQALDISCAVTPSELDNCTGPLLVPLFDLCSKDLQQKILQRKDLTILLGNQENFELPENASSVSCRIADKYTICCAVLNGCNPPEKQILPDALPERPFDWRGTYYRFVKNRMPRMEITLDFYNAAGKLIRSNLPDTLLQNPQDGARSMSFYRQDGFTLALISLVHTYVKAQCKLDASTIAGVSKRSLFPYSEVQINNNLLTLKDHMSPLHLPPMGITITEIHNK